MAPSKSRLCAYCQGLDVRRLLLDAEASMSKPHSGLALLRSSVKGDVRRAIPTFHQHRPNLASLKSAIESCDLCSTIWKEFSRQRQPAELLDTIISQGAGREPIYIGTLDWDTAVSSVPHLAVTQRGQNAHRQLACFEVCAQDDDIVLDSAHLLARLQASSAADPKCFKLASKWLTKCCSEHADCQNTSSSAFHFPTRVLQVFNDDLASQVKLVNGDQCAGQYAALSYCWGPDRDHLLTHNTVDRLRAGIPLSDIPGTIADAITVTRELKIPYLWVDALCIFQDQERQESKDDWAREAGRMRDVYRGAVLTIEAASASRASDGFLKERASSKPYCTLDWIGEDSTDCVYLRPIVDITDNQLLGARIFSRAWTLQERLLAPRTLSFGRQQISFECANGYVDEGGKSSILPRASEVYLSKYSMLQLRQDRSLAVRISRFFCRALSLPPVVNLLGTDWYSQGLLILPGGLGATYYHFWRSIIGQFTERQLTNWEDRLPALSGLADEFQRATGDYYIAGMWRTELLQDLAWSLSSPDGEYEHYPNNPAIRAHPKIVTSTFYIAPSWSWASVRGKVKFFLGTYHVGRRMRQYGKILRVCAEPRSKNDLAGNLASAHLILRAPFLRIPDPQILCSEDCKVKNLHSSIRSRYIRTEEAAFAMEFWQQHQHHEGQRFGLVKLFHEDSRQAAGKWLQLLLIESCEGGGWRRTLCFSVILASLQELEDETFGMMDSSEAETKEYRDRVGPELREIATIAAEVDEASWRVETLTLY